MLWVQVKKRGGTRNLQKKEGDGGESVKDEVREAETGLKSRNALTLETLVSVCIWHSTSCHSTGLSTHTPIYQHTHTLTHTVCFGGWSQEAAPGEENTFQGAINPPPLTLGSPPTRLPKSALLPTPWPSQPTCTSHNTLEVESHRVTLTESWETLDCPRDAAAVTLAEKDWGAFLILWPAGCPKPPGWPAPPH